VTVRCARSAEWNEIKIYKNAHAHVAVEFSVLAMKKDNFEIQYQYQKCNDAVLVFILHLTIEKKL
jgi:hypothetical protein